MATKIGQLAQELARTNSWWRGSRWAATDPDLRVVRDTALDYQSPCLDDLTPGGLYLLRGPRRVGKTVAVKQTIERLIGSGVNPKSIVRVAADAWAAEDLRTLVQNTALPPLAPGERRWWMLDEVTAAAGNWSAQIKWLRDNDPEFASATVVLTGSNASGLTAAAGVLAGRRGRIANGDRTLLPLGFQTFSRLINPDLPQAAKLDIADLHGNRARHVYLDLLPWLDTLVRLWETYLRYGGFPVAVAAARTGSPIPAWFVDDIFNVVFRDAFASSQLSQTATIALLERLMGSMSTPANLSKIGGDLDLRQETVARHVHYLRGAYLVWQCPQKAEGKWIARERAQDKLYAIDPIVGRLAHLRNPARPDIDLTVLAETQIGLALQRNAVLHDASWAEDHLLFYTRTPARKEIDFVGERLGDVAVEGKYVESGAWRREAATVNASGYRGLLVTRNVLDTEGDEAWAVPAGLLAYLIDG